MTPVNDILTPKTKQQVRDDIKHLKLYVFLSLFRQKSIFKVRGASFGRRLAHAFLRIGDKSLPIMATFDIMIVIAGVWNMIFPWTPMWKFSFIEEMAVVGIFGFTIMVFLSIPAFIIRHKTDNYEFEQALSQYSEAARALLNIRIG